MNAPSIFRQHRAARWLLPVGVISVLTIVTLGVRDSDTRSGLPAIPAARLLGDLRAAADVAVAGTVIAQLSPGASGASRLADAGTAQALGALQSGSHTARFWYGGPERQRVALLEATQETDVFRDGRNVWQWDSDHRVATHILLKDDARTPMPVSPVLPQQLATLMPQPLTAAALDAIDEDTTLSVAPNRRVADRPAHQLVLTPHGELTRVASVRIAVDAATHVPLGVEIYARGKNKPVVDVAFVSITFRPPHAALFRFTPPPGAIVAEAVPGSAGVPVTVRGTGWESVVEYRVNRAALAEVAQPIMAALQPVSGDWGHGRLLDATLMCVLVTDDGRAFAGAVEPSALYAAAAAR